MASRRSQQAALIIPPAPAKVWPPKLPRIIRRTRLHEILDGSLAKRIVWISGPPGAGKTTLVASYLRSRRRTVVWHRLDESDADVPSFVHYLSQAVSASVPRHEPLPALTPAFMPGVAVFMRRFFERLGERLPRRSVIVFDDYHSISRTAELHDLLSRAIGELRETVSIIVLSREAPPPEFSDWIARNQLIELVPESLNLQPEELQEIVSLYHPHASPQEHEAWLARAAAAAGWIAGATILLQPGSRALPTPASDHPIPAALFEYLTRAALERRPDSELHFLVRTSVLPRFTAEMAERITGESRAVSIIDGLYRARFFVERVAQSTGWYSYHPLFRTCLTQLAPQKLSTTEIRELRRSGGQALIEAGHLDEGLDLLADAGEWGVATHAIVGSAPSLLAVGRIQTVKHWLGRIPPEISPGNPWISYFRAACELMSGSPDAGRLAHEAFEAFGARADEQGQLAAWALEVSAVMARMGDYSPLDALIAWFPFETPALLPVLPSELSTMIVEAFAGALAWRQPGTARTHKWLADAVDRRALDGTANHVPPFPFLETSYLWTGDWRQAKPALERFAHTHRARAAVVSQLAADSAEAVLAWFRGDAEACRRVVQHGLELSPSEGLFLYEHPLHTQAIYSELMSGDAVAAGTMLERCRPATREPGVGTCHHAALEAWCHLNANRLDDAWDLIRPERHQPDIYVGPFAAGMAWIIRAFISLARNDIDAADQFRCRALDVAEQMDSDLLRHGAGFIDAQRHFACGDEQGGIAALASTLAIGRRREIWGCPGWHAATVARLISHAIGAGVEVQYSRELVRRRRLPRPEEALFADSWVWPVKIRALGGFQVDVHDEPLARSRKAPHRQLEVLRAIVACGAASVEVTELADRFWPDVDGDTAKENLEKTFQRLRRLLGQPDILPVRSGLVSLNPETCWIDTTAFTHLVSRRDQRSARAALHLYKGPLFGPFAKQPWELEARAGFEDLRDVAMRTAALDS